MAFDDLQTRIALLFQGMVNQPEDEHETAETIRDLLNELRATGMPLPQDLVDIEADLEARFAKGSSARR